MSAKTYAVLNAAAPGAAAAAPISTGSAIKTMLQIATNTTSQSIRCVEWWTEFDGSSAATPVRVELIRHTGGAQSTLSAYVVADVSKINDPNAPTSTIQLGTALSGWNQTTPTEIAPTGAMSLETHFVPPTSGIYVQFPLGREPEIGVSQFSRIRTTATAPVNAYSGYMWEE